MSDKEEVKKMLRYLISNITRIDVNIKKKLMEFLKTNHITKNKYQEQNSFISNLTILLSSINHGNTISDTNFNELRTFFSKFFKENKIDMEGNTLNLQQELKPLTKLHLPIEEKQQLKSPRIQKTKSPSPPSSSPSSLSPSLSPSSSSSLSPSIYDNLGKDEIIVRNNGKIYIYDKNKREYIHIIDPPLSSKGGQNKNVIRIRRIKKY